MVRLTEHLKWAQYRVPDLAVVDYRVILSSQAGHGLAVRGENYLVTTPEVRQGLS